MKICNLDVHVLPDSHVENGNVQLRWFRKVRNDDAEGTVPSLGKLSDSSATRRQHAHV
jgi:hypothetical protein